MGFSILIFFSPPDFSVLKIIYLINYVFAEPSRYFASFSHKEDDAQCFEQCEWYCKTGQVKTLNPKPACPVH